MIRGLGWETQTFPIDFVRQICTVSNARTRSKLYRRAYPPPNFPLAKEEFYDGGGRFSQISPRGWRGGVKRYPDFAIYPDASPTQTGIAAALFSGGISDNPIIEILAKDQTPSLRTKFPIWDLIY